MGLRLVPRTLGLIRAGFQRLKFRFVDKPRLERERIEREAQDRRRREEEVRHDEARAYARERGERQAIIEMEEEARRKHLEHEGRMLAVRERAEEIARQGVERRKTEREEWTNAIASAADRFGG